MKQLSKQSLILILLGLLAIVAVGVFVVQKQSEIPIVVVENGEEQENQNGEKNKGNISETVDTFDWETYRNEEYGYEVKIPVEWGIEKEEQLNMFTIKRGGIDSDNKLYFTIAITDSNKNSQSWFENNIENPRNKYNDSYEIIEENKEMKDNIFYYLKKVSDNFEYWYIDHTYIISNENKIFMIKFREKQGPENWQYDYSSHLSTFEAFVSSLSFI